MAGPFAPPRRRLDGRDCRRLLGVPRERPREETGRTRRRTGRVGIRITAVASAPLTQPAGTRGGSVLPFIPEGRPPGPLDGTDDDDFAPAAFPRFQFHIGMHHETESSWRCDVARRRLLWRSFPRLALPLRRSREWYPSRETVYSRLANRSATCDTDDVPDDLKCAIPAVRRLAREPEAGRDPPSRRAPSHGATAEGVRAMRREAAKSANAIAQAERRDASGRTIPSAIGN